MDENRAILEEIHYLATRVDTIEARTSENTNLINEITTDVRDDIEELIDSQHRDSRDICSEILRTSARNTRLEDLIQLLYDMLGVQIYTFDGELREANDVAKDLEYLNPKIRLSFKELMEF